MYNFLLNPNASLATANVFHKQINKIKIEFIKYRNR